MFSASTMRCHLDLMRPTRIFYSGDEVCGKFTLQTAMKVDIKAITISITTVERIQWLEHAKELPILYDDSSTQEYIYHNISFKNFKEYILASVELNENTVLESGGFSAQFTLCLPDQLLATSKQSNGYVEHQLEVALQTGSTTKKIFCERLFLRNRLDLNRDPKLSKPCTVTHHLPGNEIDITVPYTGFVPGQFIPFSVKVAQLLNGEKILIQFVEKITYESDTSPKKIKEVIKVHDNKILTTPCSSQLRVPFTTAISTNLDSALMKVSYYLECVVVSQKIKSLNTSQIPLTIGNVALNESERFTADETERLHSYYNIGVTRADLDEFIPPKLVKFDVIACQTQGFPKRNDMKFVVHCREAFYHLFEMIFLRRFQSVHFK